MPKSLANKGINLTKAKSKISPTSLTIEDYQRKVYKNSETMFILFRDVSEGELHNALVDIAVTLRNYIYMTTASDNGTMRVRIKEEDIVEYALMEEVKIKHEYSLKYCLLYSKFAKINKNVSLHLKDETPLKIKYDMSHWIDDNCNKQVVGGDDEAESKNYFGFYLAPKLDNEQD